MINVGLIGYGYWGPNIARSFAQTQGSRVSAICDPALPARQRAQAHHPKATVGASYQDILNSNEIDLVAIFTPASSHFAIAKSAIKNQKHIFIAKPLTTNYKDAEELVKLSEKYNTKIIVDHTFLFSREFNIIKNIIHNKNIGNIHYYNSLRMNYGPFRSDINSVWDLAPHDLSIINHLFNEKIIGVSAHLNSYYNYSLTDSAYITLYLSNQIIAHLHLNWMFPIKVRKICIGGSKNIVLWDDLEENEKIKFFNKGVQKSQGNIPLDYICLDKQENHNIDNKVDPEPLQNEILHVIDCITHDEAPISSGSSSLDIIKTLEAIDRSSKERGSTIYL